MLLCSLCKQAFSSWLTDWLCDGDVVTCLIYELDVIVLFLRTVAFKGCYFVSGEGQPVIVPTLKAVTWVCPLPVRVGFQVDIRDNRARVFTEY